MNCPDYNESPAPRIVLDKKIIYDHESFKQNCLRNSPNRADVLKETDKIKSYVAIIGKDYFTLYGFIPQNCWFQGLSVSANVKSIIRLVCLKND